MDHGRGCPCRRPWARSRVPMPGPAATDLRRADVRQNAHVMTEDEWDDLCRFLDVCLTEDEPTAPGPIATKRRILASTDFCSEYGAEIDDTQRGRFWQETLVRNLASDYANRHGYREAWQPEYSLITRRITSAGNFEDQPRGMTWA
jgi:hypothetical protein